MRVARVQEGPNYGFTSVASFIKRAILSDQKITIQIGGW